MVEQTLYVSGELNVEVIRNFLYPSGIVRIVESYDDENEMVVLPGEISSLIDALKKALQILEASND